MFGVYPLRLTMVAFVRHRIVPPDIAIEAHLAGIAGALVDDDALHAGAAFGQRLVDRALELDRGTPSPSAVRRDHQAGAGVFNAVLHGIGGEAAKYH